MKSVRNLNIKLALLLLREIIFYPRHDSTILIYPDGKFEVERTREA